MSEKVTKIFLKDEKLVQVAGGIEGSSDDEKFEALLKLANELLCEFPKHEVKIQSATNRIYQDREKGKNYESIRDDFLNAILAIPYVALKGKLITRAKLLP